MRFLLVALLCALSYAQTEHPALESIDEASAVNEMPEIKNQQHASEWNLDELLAENEFNGATYKDSMVQMSPVQDMQKKVVMDDSSAEHISRRSLDVTSSTTRIPSARPSITGVVVTLNLNRIGNVLDSNEVAYLQDRVATNYSIPSEAVTVETTYIIRGSLRIHKVPASISLDELEEVLQRSIEDALQIHSKDVLVEVNPITGAVAFSVYGSEMENALETDRILASSEFLSALNFAIREDIPTALVTSVYVNEEIEMELTIIIDATYSDEDLEETSNRVRDELGLEGFLAQYQTAFVVANPTVQPVRAPTTMIPSAMPSTTGLVAILEVSKVAESSLSAEEIQLMTAEAIAAFNGDEDSATATVQYSTVGSMTISAGGLSESAVVEALESALGDMLDLHPSDIQISYDSESGFVSYTITRDDAESLNDLIVDISQPEFRFVLDLPDELSITYFDAPDESIATVSITVDASNVIDSSSALTNAIDSIQSQDTDYTIDANVMFRTSSPTVGPTTTPSAFPSSSLPTAQPSITGHVTSIKLSSTTTEEIDQQTLDDYVLGIATNFGVDLEDVELYTTYSASGSMFISLSGEESEDEVVGAIISSIAESLGLHPSNVEASVDMSTGEVSFTVNVEDYSEIEEAQRALQDPESQSAITSGIQLEIPTVSVDDYDIAEDVTVSMDFTVDANDARNDMSQATYLTLQQFPDFNTEIENMFITQAPTFVPSLTPTTSLPSEAPSITGSVAVVALSKPVTEALTSKEVSTISLETAEAYGVNAADVVIEVAYQSSGSLDLTFLGNVDQYSLEQALQIELASLLDIHQSNVIVHISDGVARYVLTSDSADDATGYLETLRDDSNLETLDAAIGEDFLVDIVANNVEVHVSANITVTVDTTDAENNVENAASDLEESLENQGYEANIRNLFITSVPTSAPSVAPSINPTSTIPSAPPTITGHVSTATMSGVATGQMSEQEIADISSDLAEIYGVTLDEVEMEVDYVISGLLEFTIPHDISENAIIDDLEESISDVLGLHLKDVEVKDVIVIFLNNGTASYYVTATSYSNATVILDATAEQDFVFRVNVDLEESGSEVDVPCLCSLRLLLIIS